MKKYQMMQADYENRLKADMVAMLTEIQLEIEEIKNEPACCQHYKRGVNRSSDIIQHKINSLKETKDGKDASGYFEKEVYEAVKPYMDEYLNN